jgi:hypothetical protein
MYQGIPIDGDRDTMQPMFEAKWDTCPIKVVAQADYDAVAAEFAALRTAFTDNQISHYRRENELVEALQSIIREATVYACHHKLEDCAQRMFDIAKTALTIAPTEEK